MCFLYFTRNSTRIQLWDIYKILSLFVPDLISYLNFHLHPYFKQAAKAMASLHLGWLAWALVAYKCHSTKIPCTQVQADSFHQSKHKQYKYKLKTIYLVRAHSKYFVLYKTNKRTSDQHFLRMIYTLYFPVNILSSAINIYETVCTQIRSYIL